MEDVIRRCLNLCDAGFARYDPGYYAIIDRALAEVDQVDAVVKARRLCEGGPTLTSPRFAYPHIASQLRPLIGEPA